MHALPGRRPVSRTVKAYAIRSLVSTGGLVFRQGWVRTVGPAEPIAQLDWCTVQYTIGRLQGLG
jgi:hypothetical protein